MVKHTQTILRQIADKLSECVWPFYEIGVERVKNETASVRLKLPDDIYKATRFLRVYHLNCESYYIYIFIA